MTSQPQNIKAINKMNIHTANLRILGSASFMVISKTCKGEMMYKDMFIKNFQAQCSIHMLLWSSPKHEIAMEFML